MNEGWAWTCLQEKTNSFMSRSNSDRELVMSLSGDVRYASRNARLFDDNIIIYIDYFFYCALNVQLWEVHIWPWSYYLGCRCSRLSPPCFTKGEEALPRKEVTRKEGRCSSKIWLIFYSISVVISFFIYVHTSPMFYVMSNKSLVVCNTIVWLRPKHILCDFLGKMWMGYCGFDCKWQHYYY